MEKSHLTWDDVSLIHSRAVLKSNDEKMARLSLLIKRYLHDRKNYRFFIKNYVELRDLQRAADTMNTLRHGQILQPEETAAPAGARITVIAPHPDDEIMGPGGTLILALAAGCKIHVVYLTRGSPRGEETNQALESEINARELGYSIEHLDLPLGRIPLDEGTVRRFAEAVSRHAADYLWLPFLLDDHDDHRRASHLLMVAAQAGAMKARPRVWAYQVYTSLPANVIVDITAVAETKRAAIARYISQRPARDWGHYILGLNAYNTRFLHGNAPGRYAETFFDLPFEAYIDLCATYFRAPGADCYLTPAYSEKGR